MDTRDDSIDRCDRLGNYEGGQSDVLKLLFAFICTTILFVINHQQLFGLDPIKMRIFGTQTFCKENYK